MSNKRNRIVRFIQILWMGIAAVCFVEAYLMLTEGGSEATKGYMFLAIGVFAIFRFVMLRRQQLKTKS